MSAPDGSCDEPPSGDRYATWPGATVFDPGDGGTALVFYYGLARAALGSFAFQRAGSGIGTQAIKRGALVAPRVGLTWPAAG